METLLLQIPPEARFLPVITSFVENSSECLGMDPAGRMGLTLAAEELFMHMTGILRTQEDLEIRCMKGSCYVRIDFLFQARKVDLKVFNITSRLSLEDEEQLEEMGLFLAARSVDRFRFSRENNGRMCLSIVKEKAYSPARKIPAVSVPHMTDFTVRPPDQAETKTFSEMTVSCYPAHAVPSFLRYPGKLADMVAGDECRVAAAFGPMGTLGGGVCWRWTGATTVEMYGPYLFDPDADSAMSDDLLEACLNALARTRCVNLVCRYATPGLPSEQFQALGTVSLKSVEGDREQTAYFREIREDLGSHAWCHPLLEDFLQKEYQRLVLPREVRTYTHHGEELPRHAVLTAEFDHEAGSVYLSPLLSGLDGDRVLVDHLRLMHREGIANVFFAMDLGEAQQTMFTPSLFDNGFSPRMIVPSAGAGDVVIFQHIAENE